MLFLKQGYAIFQDLLSASVNNLVKPKVWYKENLWLKHKENSCVNMKESTYWTELLIDVGKKSRTGVLYCRQKSQQHENIFF